MRRSEVVVRALVALVAESGAISARFRATPTSRRFSRFRVYVIFASKAYVRDATNKNTHESNVDYAAAVFCCISFPPSPAPAPAALAASRSLNLV